MRGPAGRLAVVEVLAAGQYLVVPPFIFRRREELRRCREERPSLALAAGLGRPPLRRGDGARGVLLILPRRETVGVSVGHARGPSLLGFGRYW
jgi:hypothetical protein